MPRIAFPDDAHVGLTPDERVIPDRVRAEPIVRVRHRTGITRRVVVVDEIEIVARRDEKPARDEDVREHSQRQPRARHHECKRAVKCGDEDVPPLERDQRDRGCDAHEVARISGRSE